MGQALSCGVAGNYDIFFEAIQFGDLDTFHALVERQPALLKQTTVYERLSPLHIAAANGRLEVLSAILEKTGKPDVLSRHKQTPLMLAAMYGKISCLLKLIEAGANVLMFDSLHGRTCLHYAAYYGHADCLQAILSVAQSTPVADTWGFARFVNVVDGKGATPLHLAARKRRPECVHILLDNGALVCAFTGDYGCPRSTPLHLAARGGSLDCVRELLAWGAGRLHIDSAGRIPFTVALKHKHGACAALLNPASAEPLVWPSPLKFISELNPEAKVILEKALMDANRAREKDILKGHLLLSHSDAGVSDDIDQVNESEICCICFEKVCTIQVQDCGHQMCAHCILALCCHNKPDPSTSCLTAPVCPFCRSSIAKLVVARTKNEEGEPENLSRLRKSRKPRNLSEGSSSFKGLPAISSFGKMGVRGSGRIADSGDWVDKPQPIMLYDSTV